MSYAPHGQGMPYGMPSGRGYGNQPWNKGSARAARELGGALPEQTYSRRPQQRPPQSDSERRYVNRVAQELPDSLKSSSSSVDTIQGDPNYPDYPEYPDPAQQSYDSPSRTPPAPPPSASRGKPQKPSGPYPVPTSRIPRPQPDQHVMPESSSRPNQSSPSPTTPWPLRADSNNPDRSQQREPPRAGRERGQPGSEGSQRPGNTPRPSQGQRGAGPVPPPNNMNYGWPGQPPLQSPPGRPVRIQAKSPQAQEPWRGEEFLSPTSPNMSRPITTSSYTSDSSMGSIPDFPVPQSQPPSMPPPQQPPQQLRRMPLGPPPSARRGPSSYYSQASFVSPIVEEAEKSSHNSYASSNVIPAGVPDYYLEDNPSDDDSPIAPGGRASNAGDHDENSGLVRQASLGKRAKPALIPVKENPPQKQNISKGGIVAQAAMAAGAAGGAFAAGLGASREGTRETTPQPSLTSPTALADPSSSETSLSSIEKRVDDDQASSKRAETVASVDIFGDMQPVRTQSPVQRTGSPYKPAVSSPLSPNAPVSRLNGAKSPLSPQDAQMNAILGGLEKGGALDQDTANAMRSPQGGLGEKAGVRRPPRLNIDAVRDAEARGSLTSLPDLIRRATKLAANLDRGKTASRLGMDWLVSEARKEGYDLNRKSTSGSLSDILASFPPPGLATPTGRNSPGTRQTGWPSPGSNRGVNRDDIDPRFVFDKPGSQKAKRKCCGMPRWAFILLLVIIFLMVVAAIIVPIGLIVIPRSKSTNQGGNTALALCQKQFPCQNGGSSTLTASGSCSCLCANGFTGSQCTTASDKACSTMAIAGAPNATVGSGIPRLVDAAQSNFSIPLNTQRVLAEFSQDDVSCTTQNALVTLNGVLSKRSMVNLYIPLSIEHNPFKTDSTAVPSLSSPSLEDIHDQEVYIASPPEHKHDTEIDAPPTRTLIPRVASTISSGSTATANGIVYASGSPGASSSPSSDNSHASSSSPSSSSSAPSPSSTSATAAEESGTNTETDSDFARIAILFVLQETESINDASDAQGKLSEWFGQENPPAGGTNPGNAAKNVSLGASGWHIDLIDLTVTVKNGTVYGKGASS